MFDDRKIEESVEDIPIENLKKRVSRVFPISSSTGAGIQEFWKHLLQCAKETSVPFGGPVSNSLAEDRIVREHVFAGIVRMKDRLTQSRKPEKSKTRR
jgi:hypothetical protein